MFVLPIFEWGYQHWMEKMKLGEKLIIRKEKARRTLRNPPKKLQLIP